MTEQDEQEYSKVFKHDSPSTSDDYYDGTYDGWKAALEWAKTQQEPVVLSGQELEKLAHEEQLLLFCDMDEFTSIAQTVMYALSHKVRSSTHPAPEPDVSELVEAATKALEALEWAWGEGATSTLEFEAMNLLREALAKREGKQ